MGVSGAKWYLYDPSSNVWGTLVDLADLTWDTTQHPGDAMSAIVLPEGSLRVVFRHANDGFPLVLSISPPGDWYRLTQQVAQRSAYYPTIARDTNGDSHVFYAVEAGSLAWQAYHG